MNEPSRKRDVVHARLRTPRAAAIAGVVFFILLFAVFFLMRGSVPSDPLETGAWLQTGTTNVLAFHAAPEGVLNSATFHFGRGLACGMINIYVVKTASVFMITTSAIGVFTGLTPSWLALGGYAVAAVLLIGSYFVDWSLVVFPIWVLLISITILSEQHSHAASISTDHPMN
jgi:hypothetical protein